MTIFNLEKLCDVNLTLFSPLIKFENFNIKKLIIGICFFSSPVLGFYMTKALYMTYKNRKKMNCFIKNEELVIQLLEDNITFNLYKLKEIKKFNGKKQNYIKDFFDQCGQVIKKQSQNLNFELKIQNITVEDVNFLNIVYDTNTNIDIIVKNEQKTSHETCEHLESFNNFLISYTSILKKLYNVKTERSKIFFDIFLLERELYELIIKSKTDKTVFDSFFDSITFYFKYKIQNVDRKFQKNYVS